jgi:very-short-patch-repair endonuclease
MKKRNYSGNLHTKFRLAKKFRREMTPSEKRLWSTLRGNQLCGLHFRRQHVIRGFIVDFYCHTARLVIEIDGDVHQSQIKSDEIRDDILKSMGLTVLHLSNEIIENALPGALHTIREACLERVPDLHPGDSVQMECPGRTPLPSRLVSSERIRLC